MLLHSIGHRIGKKSKRRWCVEQSADTDPAESSASCSDHVHIIIIIKMIAIEEESGSL